jgi:hypothetical protein
MFLDKKICSVSDWLDQVDAKIAGVVKHVKEELEETDKEFGISFLLEFSNLFSDVGWR